MNENTQYLSLHTYYLYFNKKLSNSSYREAINTYNLLFNSFPLSHLADIISNFLSLLYNPNPPSIQYYITTNE